MKRSVPESTLLAFEKIVQHKKDDEYDAIVTVPAGKTMGNTRRFTIDVSFLQETTNIIIFVNEDDWTSEEIVTNKENNEAKRMYKTFLNINSSDIHDAIEQLITCYHQLDDDSPENEEDCIPESGEHEIYDVTESEQDDESLDGIDFGQTYKAGDDGGVQANDYKNELSKIVPHKKKNQEYGESTAIDSIFELFASKDALPSYRKLSEISNIPFTTLRGWHTKFKSDPCWRPSSHYNSSNRRIFSDEKEKDI